MSNLWWTHRMKPPSNKQLINSDGVASAVKRPKPQWGGGGSQSKAILLPLRKLHIYSELDSMMFSHYIYFCPIQVCADVFLSIHYILLENIPTLYQNDILLTSLETHCWVYSFTNKGSLGPPGRSARCEPVWHRSDGPIMALLLGNKPIRMMT